MKRYYLLLLMLLAPLALAATDFYTFTSPEKQSRFTALTSELRCLVCQNQTIAESNAGLANDLRDQIYRAIEAGKSNQEILDYLVKRYGDFILYNPPLRVATLALWLGPYLVLILGISLLFYYIRKSKSTPLC